MPSREVYLLLTRLGYPLASRPFEKFDSLESEVDFQRLFEVLRKFQDKNGRYAVMTTNTILTNPDFEEIQKSHFQEYKYELFTDTYKRYPGCGKSFALYQQGISEKLLFPQYHGREHFNVSRWMRALSTRQEDDVLAFNHGMVGVPSKSNPEAGNQLMINLSIDNAEQLTELGQALGEGAQLFEKIFGFKSRSFIAPVYTWSSDLEKSLYENGIEFMQGGFYQKEPLLPPGTYRKVKHKAGDRNKYGQIFLTRNVFFEPATYSGHDIVDRTLDYIKTSFFWRKPAVVSTHRLNYIGSIDPENRERNLRLLEELLGNILHQWPDIEFMTSVELGELIKEDLSL
jgi:hypothetical protein